MDKCTAYKLFAVKLLFKKRMSCILKVNEYLIHCTWSTAFCMNFSYSICKFPPIPYITLN